MGDVRKKTKPQKSDGEKAGSTAKVPSIKPRNPLAAHPLLRKSHSHEKPGKSRRSKEKQSLRKQILDDD